MTNFELTVQISASKSKYKGELMRFRNSLFSQFYIYENIYEKSYMKIEKA